ncbi:MAG: N-6 DNA methylase [Candidatus Micrarchaeaceae archaeon]
MAKISNIDDVKKLFENLHNLLWNKEGFNPEKALEHLNFFLFLKAIEPHIKSINLSDKCKFSYLVSIKDENILYETFNDIIVPEIYENDITRTYFKFIEIKGCKNLRTIINEINKIDINNSDFDLLGTLYEYIISRGCKDMSDNGQYFTNRKLCDLAVKLSLSLYENVNINMIDPFCGTGGFIISFVKFINSCLTKEQIREFWTQNKKFIYGNDIKIGNCMSTRLNLLFHTGVPFDETITQGNSFYDEIFGNQKYDFIFTNPPYGGDKDIGDEYKFKYREKYGNQYIYKVNNRIRNINIPIDAKDATAVQLCLDLLAPQGTCAIVLDDGFYFGANKKLTELRKYLVENFNIRYIVDIPQDAFENTSTKTSILIFQNNGKTEEIKILDFKSGSEIIKININEIREKNYTLNYNRYIKKFWNIPNDYKLYKLKDIISYCKVGKNKPPDDKNGKLYPYYGTSGITGYTDYFLEDGKYILCARGGTIGNLFLVVGKSWPSDHNFIIKTDENTCNLKYLYYFLKANKNLLSEKKQGTIIPGITKDIIYEIEIHLPNLQIQHQISNFIYYYDQLYKNIKESIDNMEKVLISSVNLLSYNVQNFLTIDDICTFLPKSKYPASYGREKGEYRFYVSSQDKKLYCDNYDYEDECIIIGTGGKVSIHIDFKFSSAMQTYVLKPKDNLYLPYLYYLLKGNINILENGFQGTTIKNITKEYLKSLQIPIPELSKQMSIKDGHEFIISSKNNLKIWKQIIDEKLNTLKIQ